MWEKRKGQAFTEYLVVVMSFVLLLLGAKIPSKLKEALVRREAATEKLLSLPLP